MHGKLTEGPADAWIVDESRQKVTQTYGMFMEGSLMHGKLTDRPSDAWKVDGSSWNVRRNTKS